MYKIIGIHKLDETYEVRIENTTEKTWLTFYSTQYPATAEEKMRHALMVFPDAYREYLEETTTTVEIDGFDYD